MKILCLHGFGTNSNVMKRQMAMILKYCDLSWEFYYLEAEIECLPAPGASICPPPYLCWSKDFSPASFKPVHALIHNAIKREGPFDGVFCFSLGVSVMISYLLEQLRLHPGQALPVKFGIFCASAPIFASDPDYCQNIYKSISANELQRLRSGDVEQVSFLSEPARTSVQTLVSAVQVMESTVHLTQKSVLNRPIPEIPCVLNPDNYTARLPIPTLHAYAKNDPPFFKMCSKWAALFCDQRWRRSVIHTAIHSIPRSPTEAQEMATAMKWVASKGHRASL